MPNNTTVLWIYEAVQCGDTWHTACRIIDVVSTPNEPESVWIKPTKEDGTISVLDLLRSPATVVV